METHTDTTAHLTNGPTLEWKSNEVAVLRLGGTAERVVTITTQRMDAITKLLDEVRASRPKGLIITGPGDEMFTAGADISLINSVTDPAHGAKLAAQGQDIFNQIAALPCTTVAAISGPCVGGGCELALACNFRVITDNKSSIIGLPETKLGIIPGFGGTQRLPRLIGLPAALDIILSGKTLRPAQAIKLGLVDKITKPHELLDIAAQVSIGALRVNRKDLSALTRILTYTRLGRALVRRKVTKALVKQTKGFYPAPPAAMQACIYGLDNGLEKGLKHEAEELGRMIVTPECKSLVHVYFLTENAKGLGKAGRKDVSSVYGVVIGAGAMGAGIAGLLARNEAPVILRDRSDADLDRGISQIKGELERSKHMSESERSFVLNRIERTTKSSANIANANFVIEAIFEEIEAKRALFTEMAQLVTPETILASNTSSLSITEIAKGLPNPGRVIGMHFFNPVAKMPLVEVVRGKQSSEKTIVVTCALSTKLGKFPIVVDDVPGFLVNRILSPYLNEAGYLLAEGYSIIDIDKAATGFGMPMGPIRLLDEVGLDVAAHVADSMERGYGERMKSLPHAKLLVAAGRKGKKSGAGFYDFSEQATTPHSGIRSLLKIDKPEQHSPDRHKLAERLIMALVNEAVHCLDQGVAGSPGREAAQQVDLGTVMGIGFPPFRGGVLYYAQSLGAKKVYDTVARLHQECGVRFTPAPGIKTRMESGKGFYERL